MLIVIKLRKIGKIFAVNVVPGLRSFQPELIVPYDAFVAYDRNDSGSREWVESVLIPKLESRGWNYKLFLMERDSRPGADHTMSIHAGIKHSKRLILVVGPTYSNDAWLYAASREGELQSILQRRFCVIVILHEVTVEQANTMDQLLNEYTDRNDYITVGQWNFWRILFYLMPHQRPYHLRHSDQDEGIELELMNDYILTHDQ